MRVMLFSLCLMLCRLPALAGGNDDLIGFEPQPANIISAERNELPEKFRQDDKGNLTHVEDREGNQFELIYDADDKIRHVTETNRGNNKTRKFTRKLSIERDSAGHPVRITILGIGSQRMQYNSKGTLIKVDVVQTNRKPFCGGRITGSNKVVPIGKHNPLQDPLQDQIKTMMEKLQSMFKLANKALPSIN